MVILLKVLFIDIDGTIRINKKINPKIITSLKELKNLGVKVILSTGRNFLHARKVARYLGTYPLLITCNGSLVKRMDNNETIKNGKIPRATIRKVFKITSSLDCKLLAHEANNNYYIRKNDDISPDIVGMTITSKDYDTMLTLPEAFKKKIPEVEVVNSSKALYLGEKIPRKIYFHDLNLKGLTKGFGVRTTFNYLGETSDEAIAIGDSNNDISMMSLVKTSVATQNATPDLKKNCNTVLTESLELYLQKLVEELQMKGKNL